MTEKRDERILAIIGPTGSGKTEISFLLSNLITEKHNKTPEIISADSRQIYKHIPIATSQPPPNYLKNIKHYFINELELNEVFNAGEFGIKARKIIKKILDENKVPIIIGGSGLYLHSLIYGLFELDPDVTSELIKMNYEDAKIKLKEIRKDLNERLKVEGVENLYKELQKIDPVSAKKMYPQNQRRIIRALEIFYLTGVPISILHHSKSNVHLNVFQVGIRWDRKKLYERINKRVDRMIANGLIDEIKNLKLKWHNYVDYNSLNTVGVKEVFDYLDGKINYERMVELIKRNTRRFAKRQLTWFRRDRNIHWIEIREERELKKTAEEIFNLTLCLIT